VLSNDDDRSLSQHLPTCFLVLEDGAPNIVCNFQQDLIRLKHSGRLLLGDVQSEEVYRKKMHSLGAMLQAAEGSMI
jgi:hypothetical protein